MGRHTVGRRYGYNTEGHIKRGGRGSHSLNLPDYGSDVLGLPRTLGLRCMPQGLQAMTEPRVPFL